MRKKFFIFFTCLSFLWGGMGFPSFAALGGSSGSNGGGSSGGGGGDGDNSPPPPYIQLDPSIFGLFLRKKLEFNPPRPLPMPPPKSLPVFPEEEFGEEVSAPPPSPLPRIDWDSLDMEILLSFQLQELPMAQEEAYGIGKQYTDLDGDPHPSSLQVEAGRLGESPYPLSTISIIPRGILDNLHVYIGQLLSQYSEVLQRLEKLADAQDRRHAPFPPEEGTAEFDEVMGLQEESRHLAEELCKQILINYGGTVEDPLHLMKLEARPLTAEELAREEEEEIRERNGWHGNIGVFLIRGNNVEKIHLSYRCDIFYRGFLSLLAGYAGNSVSHLIFTEAGGLPLIQYIDAFSEKEAHRILLSLEKPIASGKDFQRLFRKLTAEAHPKQRGKIYRFLLKETASGTKGIEGLEVKDVTKELLLDLLYTGREFHPFAFSSAEEADRYWSSFANPTRKMDRPYAPNTITYTNRLQPRQPTPSLEVVPPPPTLEKPKLPLPTEPTPPKKDRVPNTGAACRKRRG